ncbi:MAG: exo-alpha-sialidase [Clostridia bacterium]|nr:exo-alpha-sialidase [Clostridia bacterium]
MQLLRREFICERSAPSCHASTLALTEHGVVAAWFDGTWEGEDDVRILCSRRENGSWTKPVLVSDDDPIPHWNPVLFHNGSELLLFYKYGKTIAHWQTLIRRSSDGGVTWSAPERLCKEDDGGRGPVKNKPIRLTNGYILAPASIEQGKWRCFTDLSRDNGLTWEKSGLIELPDEALCAAGQSQWNVSDDTKADQSAGIIQPSLWEDNAGVHMLMRSNTGYICRSDSPDGVHWCAAYPTPMPNNNSGLDLVRASDGRIFLCCNPNAKNWGERTPLTLFVSENDGVSFTRVLDLETEPGEYSYPSVIEQSGILYGTYTWRRTRIAYFEVKI